MNHRFVLEQLDAWVHADDNIRAAVLTGSVARGADAFDELSDLDVELYVREPSRLLERDEWYREFGEVLVVEALSNQGWNPTRLVYYVDGKIDFTIMACNDARSTRAASRDAQILLDKDAILTDLARDDAAVSRPPTQVDFDICINWFYAAAIMAAKCLVRGELWSAKLRDNDAKAQLLRMIEWDHKARYGWSYDTWHNARHMHDWMDPDVVDALSGCWSALAAEPSADALRATVTLFDRLATRTAAALELRPFDTPAVAAEVQQILSRL